MKLSMSEELLLLMLDDERGVLREGAGLAGDYALSGALLAELALAGRIDSDPAKVWVANPAPTGDELQDEVLARIAADAFEHDTRYWIETLGTDADGFRDTLLKGLVAKGVLRAESGRFLWVFAERRYPAVSGKEEREVKARVLGVLFDDEIPDPRDSLLIGLCRAAGLFALILAPAELERVQPRIEQVSNLEELNRSLTDAIREIYARISRYAPI
ncbi:GOLPH3/VPS74 family protein [Falsiroseomonas sp. HW251]|uniref:GOLPH3/VPS74 family protein n=1 Tax=Falsiroseomonas sp. HW251 TaxID=3390998 RepID=UPI003D319138